MKNNKSHVYQVINKHVTLLNCLFNSEYTGQYVPLMFLSSLLTAVIATLIFYLILKRRSYNKDTLPTLTTQLGPIYDVKLPETSEQKEIIELQGNMAYGL